MAENSGRGNIIDAADAPRGGDVVPPPVSPDVKDAVRNEARDAGAGMHDAGQEKGMRPDGTVKVKTVEQVQQESETETETETETGEGVNAA